MPEPRLRTESVELGHRLQNPGMIAGLEPLHSLSVSGSRLGCEDVFYPGCLVLAQFPQRPKGVTECPGGHEHHLAITRSNSITQRSAQPQIVLRICRLAYANRDPPLVRQTLAKEFPEVGGGVKDRKMIIGDRSDPGPMIIGPGRDQMGKVRISEEVVRPLSHSSLQLLRGEQAFSSLLRSNDKLD